MDTLCITYITCPDMKIAKSLAEGAVKGNLAACVNIIQSVSSVYEWQGKINCDDEVLLIAKSLKSKIRDLEKFVLVNHPYDIPEFVTVEASFVTEGYLNWACSGNKAT